MFLEYSDVTFVEGEFIGDRAQFSQFSTNEGRFFEIINEGDFGSTILLTFFLAQPLNCSAVNKAYQFQFHTAAFHSLEYRCADMADIIIYVKGTVYCTPHFLYMQFR